jgi:hypothetical protein
MAVILNIKNVPMNHIQVIVVAVMIFGWGLPLLASAQTPAAQENGRQAETPDDWTQVPVSPGQLSFQVDGSGVEHTVRYEPSCSNRPGTDPTFHLFVRETESPPDGLILYMGGGGACWSGSTCNPGNPDFLTYADEIGDRFEKRFLQANEPTAWWGSRNPESPVRNYAMIHVNSCTGDQFAGSRDVEYTDSTFGGGTAVIRHRGFDNAIAGLHYAEKTFGDVAHVIVSGQSAGASGAILLFPYVREVFEDTRVDLLADANPGIVPEEVRPVLEQRWGISDNDAEWIGDDEERERRLKAGDYTLTDYYVATASHYPESRFAQFIGAWDISLTYFYYAMERSVENPKPPNWGRSVVRKPLGAMRKGNEVDLNTAIPQRAWCDFYSATEAALHEISGAVDNFRFFRAPTFMHTMQGALWEPYEGVHNKMNIEANGVTMKQWLNGFLGTSPWQNVDCQGDCSPPPGVDACSN